MTAPTVDTRADDEKRFAEWFARNYPEPTVISDPHWHALRIYREAIHAYSAALLAARREVEAARDALTAIAVLRPYRDPTYPHVWLNEPSSIAIAAATGHEGITELADAALARVPEEPRACDECEWTNTELLNVGDSGKPRWLCHGCIKRLLDGPPAEMLAAKFHETYELLAPKWGYKTREASAKPWGDVPEPNKSLMVAVAHEVLVWLSLRVPSGGEEGR